MLRDPNHSKVRILQDWKFKKEKKKEKRKNYESRQTISYDKLVSSRPGLRGIGTESHDASDHVWVS